jgi:hypothetical protein
LRDAARAYAVTAGKAKKLGVTVTDAMDEPAIMKAVVDAKLGDKAKGWTDAQSHRLVRQPDRRPQGRGQAIRFADASSRPAAPT